MVLGKTIHIRADVYKKWQTKVWIKASIIILSLQQYYFKLKYCDDLEHLGVDFLCQVSEVSAKIKK